MFFLQTVVQTLFLERFTFSSTYKLNTQAFFTTKNKAFSYKGIDLPVQFVPSPVYPALHVHVKLPSVSVHAALLSQLAVPSVHSSMSDTKSSIQMNAIAFDP